MLLLLNWSQARPRADGPKIEIEDAPRWESEPNELRFQLVEHFLDRQDYGRAMGLIDAMRAEKVEDPRLDLFQGIVYREQALYDDALGLLERAGKALPRDARVEEALCVLHADRQQLDPAIEACRRAVRLDEGSLKGWNNLGFLLLAAGQTADAVQALESALQLNGSDARVRNNLALALVAEGETERAHKTLLTTSLPADAAYNVGVALERYADRTQATTWYDRALRADPVHPLARAALDRLSTSEQP